MPLKCELRYDWFTVWRGPINQWAPCNFYCGFVWSFLFLHNNATVKGKQTHSGDAALKRLLHRQNQPDLRPHLRGCQSWWLYRTVWLLRKFSVVVFCWRCKNERVFFKGNVPCFYRRCSHQGSEVKDWPRRQTMHQDFTSASTSSGRFLLLSLRTKTANSQPLQIF